MDKQELRKLKGKAQSIPPTVRVGKSGITEQVLAEISVQLDKRHLVKIKVLGCDKGEIRLMSDELAMHTASELVDVRGNTIVLWRS